MRFGSALALALIAAPLAAAAFAAGCTQAELCVKDQEVSCTCGDGRRGVTTCESYGVPRDGCDCSATPVDAGPRPDAGPPPPCAPAGMSCTRIEVRTDNVYPSTACPTGQRAQTIEGCDGSCADATGLSTDARFDYCGSSSPGPDARSIVCCG